MHGILLTLPFASGRGLWPARSMPERPFEVSPELYPFEDRWFSRDGVAMHYVDHGEGPAVVMMHGNPTWSCLYRDVIAGLKGKARCLAPDYPGFGMSQHPPGFGYTPMEHAQWAGEWLDSLGLRDFVMVVQDWGGPIGLRCAIDRADRVAGLVILNTWAWPADVPATIFSWILGGPLGKYLHLQRNFFADKIVRGGMYYAKRKPEEVFRAYTDPFPTPASRMGTYVFPRAIRQSGPWLADIEAGLATLADKPIEMVWGMKDFVFANDRTLARWQRLLPKAALTRLDKASHYLQEDQPEAIAEAIGRVLERSAHGGWDRRGT
jgi:haloalkane dehalogenase